MTPTPTTTPPDPVLTVLHTEEKTLAAQLEAHPVYRRLTLIRNMIHAFSTGVDHAPAVAAAAKPQLDAAGARLRRPKPAAAKPAATGKRRGRPLAPEKVAAITNAASAYLAGVEGGAAHPKDILGAVAAAGIQVAKDQPAQKLAQILKDTGKFDFDRGRGFSVKKAGVNGQAGEHVHHPAPPPVDMPQPAEVEAVA